MNNTLFRTVKASLGGALNSLTSSINKIDILLLNGSINIPNYFTYTSNRPQVPGHSVGGGTAILVHRRYIHRHVVTSTTSLENTTVHIKVNNTVLRLVATYKRPANFFLTADLIALLDTPYITIVAGDLSSKNQIWLSRRHNTTSNVSIASSTPQMILLQLLQTPRRITRTTKTTDQIGILDIAIVKTNNIHYHIENLSSDIYSNHTPVVLELHSTSACINPPGRTHVVDYATFLSIMDSVCCSSSNGSTTSSIDLAINNLIIHMSNIIVKSTS